MGEMADLWDKFFAGKEPEPLYKAALLEILKSEHGYIEMYYGNYDEPPSDAIIDGTFNGPYLQKALEQLHNEGLLGVPSKRP